MIKLLELVQAPLRIQLLLAKVWLLAPQGLVADVGFVEFMAGAMAVTLAQRVHGVLAIPYDIEYEPVLNDFNSKMGFLFALFCAIDLEMGAASLCGIVCSSFGFVNSGTAARCAFLPLGDISCAHVRSANKMVARMVIIIVLLTAKGVFWVVEQPCGSRLELHPAWQWLCSWTRVFRVTVSAGNLGALSVKRLWLYSNEAYQQ